MKLTREQIEERAKHEIRFLAWYCIPNLEPKDVRRFHLILLLVGAKLDCRELSDDSLEWVHALYCNPGITKKTDSTRKEH